ncbi:hypothetical protein [Paenibacillus pini]|uniref:Uncharacterized protein n=1 Tax=Paenibacillus pini JCM 16418 TaxID=1236976 RepID=W7YF52_9BACL|nr:hypothetical protein [Paenibacillus pini]GAF06123.1 hypothetical protein JCM16418_68 [Paenibacillus pini JCM 16418]
MRKISLFTTMIVLSLLTFVTSANAVGYENKTVPQITDHSPVNTTAMLSSIEQREGHLYIQADKIEWYEGAAADKKFLEREQDIGDMTGAPDGYYIVNDDIQYQTYEIDPDAQVLMQLYDHDGTYEGMNIQWNEPVTLEKYKAIMDNDTLMDMKTFPYHLTLKDGKVVKIVQQYIP